MTKLIQNLIVGFLGFVKSQPRQRRKVIYILAATIALAAIAVVLIFAGNRFTLWSYQFVIPPRLTVIIGLIPLAAPLLALVHLSSAQVTNEVKTLASDPGTVEQKATKLVVDITPSVSQVLAEHLHDVADHLTAIGEQPNVSHQSVPIPPKEPAPTPAPVVPPQKE